jgi:hypothetical protein
MNDTTKRDDEHHPVRKLLQTLPKIPAREDFIERLHRRLAEKPQKKTLWSSLEISPIPAYSLSVIALVIAGAVFYFSFIRTERGSVEYKTKQADFQREEPPPQTTAQPPQTTQGSQTAGERRIERRQQLPETAVTMDTSVPSEHSLNITGGRQSSPPLRESVQDVQRQMLLREVGGTGLRSLQPSDTSPFLRPTTGISAEILDSIARADSLKRDSLMKPQQNENEGE